MSSQRTEHQPRREHAVSHFAKQNLTWRSSLTAFGVIFAALWLTHWPLLHLPYFWDEAGYFIPAARDLLLYGEWVPHTTLSNAHPPLFMAWLALAWKLTAYTPFVTRSATLLVAAAGLTALWRLACRIADQQTACASVILAALSPTIFSQSAMPQLDIAAFALVLWMLDAHLAGQRGRAVVFAALAAVTKETTLPVTLTLCGVDLLSCWAWRWRPQLAARWQVARSSLRQALAYLLAVVPLVGWYAYHHHVTGHVFGNPDYLRYNVSSTVTPLRIAVALGMRLWHAGGYLNLFVLTVPALYLAWQARGERPNAGAPIAPATQLLLALVILAQAAEFSVVGGALLARYMISAVALTILLATHVVRRHAPRWPWWIAGCAATFVAALLLSPPWFIAPEDNLTWTRIVRLHQHAARYLTQHYADQRILTAWPASDELNRPFLGYVAQPLTVVRIENFSAEEVLRAQAQPDNFDVVFAFSTKYEPPRGFYRNLPGWMRLEQRYFDFHQDLPPEAVAQLLGGRLVWRETTPGAWAAIIEVEKIHNAYLRPPNLLPQ